MYCGVTIIPDVQIGITGIFAYLQYGGTNLPPMYRYDSKTQCMDRVKSNQGKKTHRIAQELILQWLKKNKNKPMKAKQTNSSNWSIQLTIPS